MLQNKLHTTIEYAKYRFEKAIEMVKAAKIVLANNDYCSANNRVYYAFFYAIRSILAINKIDFKKHSAVIGYFLKNYVATSIFDKKYGRIIKDAFEIRQNSDYEDFYIINKQETEELISNAESFLKDVKAYLLKQNVL